MGKNKKDKNSIVSRSPIESPLERVARLINENTSARTTEEKVLYDEARMVEVLAAELAVLLDSPAYQTMPLFSFQALKEPRRFFRKARSHTLYIRQPIRFNNNPSQAIAIDKFGQTYIGTGTPVSYSPIGDILPRQISAKYLLLFYEAQTVPTSAAVAKFEELVVQCRTIHAEFQENLKHRSNRAHLHSPRI